MNVDAVRASVGHLRDRLEEASIALETVGVDEARRTREETLRHIDDYLLPRLERMDAPLLAVVGGSTGAGKSTLVNSLVGAVVSPAGVLRPTTTTPIVVANPADLHWFEGARVLPDLPRLTGKPRTGDHGLYLVGDDHVPQGMALLDAPDIDSVVATNRLLAAQLLAAADLWLFVTTAARYADNVPWEFLREAHRRSASLALVLNRVPPEALEEVPLHLAQMLSDEGLAEAPVVTIPEARLDDGLIPRAELRPLTAWWDGLAADAGRRRELIRRTLEGALNALPQPSAEIVECLEHQITAAEALVTEASQAYSRALQDIEDGLSAGTLLRGEVLARWYEFIGTGDFMRSVQSTIGKVRDRIGDVLFGRPPIDAEVRSEVGSRIDVVVVAACDKALERTVDAWRARPEGRKMIVEDVVPTRSSSDLRDRIDAAVRAWQGRVLELVAEQGQDKRAIGRALSLGVNATGTALMIAVFANTGGLTGGEVVVAGGTAALSQRVLEAVFGDQAVRSLTTEARSDLLQRLSDVLREEAERFERPVREAMPASGDVDELRAAAARLQQAVS